MNNWNCLGGLLGNQSQRQLDSRRKNFNLNCIYLFIEEDCPRFSERNIHSGQTKMCLCKMHSYGCNVQRILTASAGFECIRFTKQQLLIMVY